MAFRTYFILFLLLTFYHTSQSQMIVGNDTLTGNEWLEHEREYYKFFVEEDGICRINRDALESAGILPDDLTGSDIRLYNNGEQVPIFVSTENVFGPNDYIEFFGYKNRGEFDQYLFRGGDTNMLNTGYSMYTDRRAYFLALEGSDLPRRVQSIHNDISNPPLPEPYYLHNESLLYFSDAFDPYFPLAEGGVVSYSSYMRGEGFARAAENNSVTQIQALNRYADGPDANLHVRFVTTNWVSHTLIISFNGVTIDSVSLINQEIFDKNYSIPVQSLLDNNQLTITSKTLLSRHAIVKVELTYPHTPSLATSPYAALTLPGQSGNQYYELSGFQGQGTAPIIYSYDGQFRMVADTDISNNVLFNWPQTLFNLPIVIAEPETAIRYITELEEIVFPDFSNDDTEYIVITHPALMETGTVSEYIQYRSSQAGGGYRAKAYSILDLYDQFGYGVEKHPQAIRNFVEFAHRNWPSAKMIFIIGRGIEYFRSRVPGTWEPSFFVPTFGRPGSDNLLAATLWGLMPRYPIGRIAITNPEQLDIYLDKVREYDAVPSLDQTIEEKAWIKNVIHIGGGKTASEQQNFKEDLNELAVIAEQSDFGASTYFFQKESTDLVGESQSKQIEHLLNTGSTLINYLGHSSANTFEFTINDPSEWNNKGRYPIFSAMGCSAGQIHGTLPSLSDRYVMIADEGAIAFLSGSGSQYAAALINWAKPWYNYFGKTGYGSTLGESNNYALQAVRNYIDPASNNSNHHRFLLEQQTLQGDPAIRLHPSPGPDYLIDRKSVMITPNILDTKQDSFDLAFSIMNIGRNLGENIEYRIDLKFPDGAVNELAADSVRASTFNTQVMTRLPLDIDKKPGIYRLLITIDPDNISEELPAPDAEFNNRLIDNLGVEGIEFVIVDNIISAVYPPDFAIVNKPVPELIATNSNAFIKRQDIVIEIDTTALFNSPLLHRQKFPDHQGTLKWTPPPILVPDHVHYWRVSTDSISPVPGYIWSRRSFLYKPGSPSGWNQSHFHQFTDNSLDKILPDSANRTFRFDSKVTNLRILNRYHGNQLPFGFIDGIFYTEFFTKFNLNNIHVFVIAIDPVTGEFMTNPNPGLYGSFNNLSYDTRCFAYATDTPESRQALINFVDNIVPDDYLVFFYTYQRPAHPSYFPELWESDENTFGRSIFSMIESYYPTSNVRVLASTGSKPYIVFFQKDHGGVEEIIAQDTAEAISLSYDIKESLTSGAFRSRLVGPASSWHAIQWAHHTTAPDTAGNNILSAYAISKDLTDTILISAHLTSQDTNISSLDAKQYPFIQLSLSTQDSVTFHPADLDYWRVLYDGFPEFIINTDIGFDFINDTLFQGQLMKLSTYVENVSEYPADSLTISLRTVSENNTIEELRQVLSDMNPNSFTQVNFEKPTNEMIGDYQVVMQTNPDRSVDEENYTNNIGILPMHVIGDVVNPVLDVTFDGYHILDGDLVASRPMIVIQLHDENEYLRLHDTSAFDILLKFPSDPEPKRIAFSDNWVQFIPSEEDGKNLARVELRPDLFEDGIYELHVRAEDASGNASGDNDYFITFEVINAKSISYLYNYPNPFNNATKFVYTLTGDASPSYYKIQIMSISGKIVREITQDELGPLSVGTHMTDYTWDGTDESGERLAAGTYLYRMVVKKEDLEDFDHYETSQDQTFFNKGWGKLVILR